MPTPDDLRNGLNGLTKLASADLAALWQQLQDVVTAREALVEVLPALVDRYGSAAATYAADWYDQLRADLNVSGRFTAVPAEIGDAGTAALAGWAVGPLFSATPDWSSALTLAQGGLQRRIANVARSTVSSSALMDPHAEGWQRIGSGECAFCAMLIGRGAVYSETGADFASHDHCHCAAVPAFVGHPRPVKPYTPSSRNSTPAERAAVRRYLAEH